jgi:aminopeptidase-like protein
MGGNDLGHEMYKMIGELFPICRSITGNGVRETLSMLQEKIPLIVHEVPSGTQVFDWKVPKEWNIQDAYIKNRQGTRVVDFQKSNLHVVGYSVPVRKTLSLNELKSHVFTLPDHPDWIPYRTSYYKKDWGFCLTHNEWLNLQEEEYDVCIDSTLEDGSLTYGELFLRGQSSDEVLISCHICHPSLCNDNLSGIAAVTFLAKYLADRNRRYSYRIIFLPGTIGPITWLSLNEERVPNIKHGLVVALVGDPGPSTYKKSRQGHAEIDRIVAHVLAHAGSEFQVREFSPYGYDERQYCSPGFNLPVGCFMRTPNGCFPEYHTSADNLDLVQPQYLEDSYQKLRLIMEALEGNKTYVNLNPKCEPQLGRRGLYRTLSGQAERGQQEIAMFWVLNLSDGTHSLLDIAERADMPFALIKQTADRLEEAGLLQVNPT